MPEVESRPENYAATPEVVVSNKPPERLAAHDAEAKFLVEVEINGQKTSAVMRGWSDEDALNWKAYHESGLPVPAYLGTTTRNGSEYVLLADLKKDGGELYGKSLSKGLSLGEERSRPPVPGVDDRFTQLISNDASLNKIADAAQACAKKATKNGLLLPNDDAFELLVHPNGDWELVILDVRYGVTEVSGSSSDTDATNLEYVNDFLKNLHKINDRLNPQARRRRFGGAWLKNLLNR